MVDLSDKKYSTSVLLCSIFILLCTSSINILVNPYGVYPHSHILNRHKNFSDFSLRQFYAYKRKRSNTILLGSSRIHNLHNTDAQKYTQGSVFNLSLPGANLFEIKTMFEYATRHPKTRHVVLEIPFFSMNPEKTPTPNFQIKRFNTALYVPDYINATASLRTLLRSLKTVRENWSKRNQSKTKYGVPLTFTVEQKQRKIAEMIADYKKYNYYYNSLLFQDPTKWKHTLHHLDQIFKLAHQRNIKVTYYVSPLHVDHLRAIFEMKLGSSFFHWLRFIAQHTPFYSFLGCHPALYDGKNFLDSNHITFQFGHVLLQRIFGAQTAPKMQGLGHWITAANIQKHIKDIQYCVRHSQGRTNVKN